MATNTSIDLIELIKNGLEDAIKQELTEQLVTDEIERFEKTLRERVKHIVNRLTMDKVQAVKKAHLHDGLHLHIHWTNKND